MSKLATTWLDECDKEADALSIELQQKFLDCIWSGMNIGEALKKTNITFNAANGIIRKNILNTSYLSRRAAK